MPLVEITEDEALGTTSSAPTAQRKELAVTPERAARTTAGGVARSFGSGLVKGAGGVIEVGGSLLEGLGGLRESLAGDIPVVGSAIQAASRVDQSLGRAVAITGRAIRGGAETFIEGEGVGDTVPERVAGAVGEVAGGAMLGGAAGAAGSRVQQARAGAAVVGGGLGLGAARELSDSPVAELAGVTAGGMAGIGVRFGARGSRAIWRAFKDQGEEAVDSVTAKTDEAMDAIDEIAQTLGKQYEDLDEAASAVGIFFNTQPLKNMVAGLRKRITETEGRAAAKDFFDRVRNLPEEVPYSVLRGHQQAVNRELHSMRKFNAKKHALDQLSGRYRQYFSDLDSQLLKLAKGGDRLQSEVAGALTTLNRSWARMQDQQKAVELFVKGSDALIGRTRSGISIRSGNFQKWLTRSRKDVIARFGKPHFDNLRRLARNIDRIPDATARAIVGEVDKARSATRAAVLAGIRFKTTAIGNLRTRGRVFAERVTDVFSDVAQERRGLAAAEAIQDPVLAQELVKQIGGKRLPPTGLITRGAGALSPALVEE